MKTICQSCGMPLDQDPQKGGTNADVSKSAEYCSYCYEKGNFHDNFKTAKEMQDFVKKKLKEMKYNSFLAWLFSLSIPNLKRWKKQK